MNYLDTVLQKKDEPNEDFKLRIFYKRRELERKFSHYKIVVITLMGTSHFYKEKKK